MADSGRPAHRTCGVRNLRHKELGIVEAKKLTLGPQNVLTQSERYSRGAEGSPFDLGGFRIPFLYSTNGEVTWFHDVRRQRRRVFLPRTGATSRSEQRWSSTASPMALSLPCR